MTAQDDSALVPRAGGEEVRRQPAVRAGAAENGGRNRSARRQDGQGERALGLHTDQRCLAEPGAQDRSKHDQAHLAGTRHRPGPRTWAANVLGDIHQSAFGRAGPNLNAFAERFVLSINTECLDRLIPLGEIHQCRAILDYTNHYHEERNHQDSTTS